MDIKNSTIEKLTYTVKEVSLILGLPVRSAYNFLNNTKDFKVMKIGKRILVQKKSFDEWFEHY